ncbi:methylaspartate ammonia-lyase [Streptomyces glomeratus]|uniref:methylaspartate ammonia-lyase n=1 Tax=Streptomyces glomeratus TaxID=284452 RepID=UPI001F1BE65B|nr:methylaspartate ammonia-lyase [Streptomyces glomeratus]MCF1510911.1 methylaspartate ammonia-lyase [Streptomyces glomeratus]
MKINDVVTVPVHGGFFYDDLAAIRQGAAKDHQWYEGEPVTPGFTAVRMPARGLGIGLVLEDGRTVWGDAVAVQYSGAGGREPLFTPDVRVVEELRAVLSGRRITGFRQTLGEVLADFGRERTALVYGLSQALLGAAAAAAGRTMCEVVCREYGFPLPHKPVPVYAQSGDDRRGNADKMLIKRVDALPHGLVNNRAKFGPEGRTLLDYIAWLVRRTGRLADNTYRPVLHFDVYGMAGREFGRDIERVADYLIEAERVARPYPLRVESPIDFGGRQAQIDGLRRLREAVGRRGGTVRIVADEWCNTLADIREFVAAGACDMVQIKMPDLGSVEDSILGVRECREAGVGAFLGGSCAETELSARVSVHVALATGPEMQLAKPGMGVDEGLMIVANEQARVLAMLGGRAA